MQEEGVTNSANIEHREGGEATVPNKGEFDPDEGEEKTNTSLLKTRIRRQY